MDNRNCLTWEEWIRLNDVTLPHVLEMQDIIIEQEETIRELESVLDDKNHLLGSFDFDSLEKELNILEQNCWREGETQIINITKILDNFKLRIMS